MKQIVKQIMNLRATSGELREKFLDFFAARGHVIVPSSSLLPDDPSVLLTSAGMQQFKPYYTGRADPAETPHPTLEGKPLGSKNAASAQKCFRTSDIDEVGDETHLTFFEMLGNFSFGGYFKSEAIHFAKEFFDHINLPVQYVTVFGGDERTPKDEASIGIWGALGFSEKNGNLKLAGRADNFWGPTGDEGPCGPTTEIYMNDVEIWNIVFNEYYHEKDGALRTLEIPGVDTGMGLERLAMISQKVATVFDTDIFHPIIGAFPTAWTDVKVKRILADHARGIVFLISDGVLPSNKDRGYILRKLIRRSIVHLYSKEAPSSFSGEDTLPMEEWNDFLAGIKKVIESYQMIYPEIFSSKIFETLEMERKKFGNAYKNGVREMRKMKKIDAISAFKLYESYGLPFESIKEMGGENARVLTREDFDREFKKHQDRSRAGQEKKFGGHGLILDTGELKAANEEELAIVTRHHTATHLLQAALRKVLGESVRQSGSDITVERLRFDFTFDRKVTPEELARIESLVNDAIARNLTMGFVEMPYGEAIKTGALYFEREKYPASVKVYSAVDSRTGEVFSRELCGGPHVLRTSELVHFKIMKEESVAGGIRRIRAIVKD